MRGLLLVDEDAFKDGHIFNLLKYFFLINDCEFSIGILHKSEAVLLDKLRIEFTNYSNCETFLLQHRDTLEHSARVFFSEKYSSNGALPANVSILFFSINPLHIVEAENLQWKIITPVFNPGELMQTHVVKFKKKLDERLQAKPSDQKQAVEIYLDLDETVVFYWKSLRKKTTLLNMCVINFLKELINNLDLNITVRVLTARKNEDKNFGGCVSINAILQNLFLAMNKNKLFDPDKISVDHGENKYEIMCRRLADKPDTLGVLIDDNPDWTRIFDETIVPRPHLSYISVHSLSQKTGMPILACEDLRRWFKQVTPLKSKQKRPSFKQSMRSLMYKMPTSEKENPETSCCVIM